MATLQSQKLQEQLQALQLKMRAVVPNVRRLTSIDDSSPLLPPEADVFDAVVQQELADAGKLDRECVAVLEHVVT